MTPTSKKPPADLRDPRSPQQSQQTKKAGQPASHLDCICEWPDGCAGLGVLYCDGCGGDLCVCGCGGESQCFGCDECEGIDSDNYDYGNCDA